MCVFVCFFSLFTLFYESSGMQRVRFAADRISVLSCCCSFFDSIHRWSYNAFGMEHRYKAYEKSSKLQTHSQKHQEITFHFNHSTFHLNSGRWILYYVRLRRHTCTFYCITTQFTKNKPLVTRLWFLVLVFVMSKANVFTIFVFNTNLFDILLLLVLYGIEVGFAVHKELIFMNLILVSFPFRRVFFFLVCFEFSFLSFACVYPHMYAFEKWWHIPCAIEQITKKKFNRFFLLPLNLTVFFKRFSFASPTNQIIFLWFSFRLTFFHLRFLLCCFFIFWKRHLWRFPSCFFATLQKFTLIICILPSISITFKINNKFYNFCLHFYAMWFNIQNEIFCWLKMTFN